MKIEVGKFYKDKIGRKVRIYVIEENGEYPVHGAVFDELIWESRSFMITGRFHSHLKDSDSDIVSEWQEPLDFDWDCLPKWADKWIVYSFFKKTWFSFNDKPKITNLGFSWSTDHIRVEIKEEYYPKNFSGCWEDSLFKNPKYED